MTRVRPMLDRGTVRITVEHPDGDAAPGDVADGTFCFLTGDVLDVDRPGHPAAGAPRRPTPTGLTHAGLTTPP